MIHRPAFRSLETFTQAEFARWCEALPPGDLFHYELLDGFIVREPPAGWPHSETALEVASRLVRYVRERKLGRVFESSQGFDLATGDTVEPDISFVSAERWMTLARPIRGFLKVAPNLVFEVLSPSTKRIDEKQKKRIYERSGVEEYVLVDPRSRGFETFHFERGAFSPGELLAVGDAFESRILPGFTIPVADAFPEE